MADISSLMPRTWEKLIERGHPSRPPTDFEYEGRVIRAYMALSTTYEELQHTLNLLSRASSFAEIRALLKLYAISWMTLSDVLATVINEAFDLGYAEQDVELGALLRNRKIKSTEMPAVITRHGKKLGHKTYAKMRNDVVHRGRLVDPEFDALHNQWLFDAYRAALRNELLESKDLDRACEIAGRETGIAAKIRDFTQTRRLSLTAHLEETRLLLDEVDIHLGREVERRA